MYNLLQLVLENGDAGQASLAAASLEGDGAALHALHDSLEEDGMDGPKVGEQYLIQSVTHYWVGRVVASTLLEITLDRAACVYDVGSLRDAFGNGKLQYAETYPPESQVTLSRTGVVCYVPWPHPLPKEGGQ